MHVIIAFVSNETHASGHADFRFSRHNLSRVTASYAKRKLNLRKIFSSPS